MRVFLSDFPFHPSALNEGFVSKGKPPIYPSTSSKGLYFSRVALVIRAVFLCILNDYLLIAVSSCRLPAL